MGASNSCCQSRSPEKKEEFAESSLGTEEIRIAAPVLKFERSDKYVSAEWEPPLCLGTEISEYDVHIEIRKSKYNEEPQIITIKTVKPKHVQYGPPATAFHFWVRARSGKGCGQWSPMFREVTKHPIEADDSDIEDTATPRTLPVP